MEQPIVGYHKDRENHWVAKLFCGHNQHVRHDPPWSNREWTETVAALDRLTHRCHIIETKGESYRLKDAKRRSGKAQTPKKKSA